MCNFRGMPTANTEGWIESEGGTGKVPVGRVFRAPSGRHGPSAPAAGMLRNVVQNTCPDGWPHGHVRPCVDAHVCTCVRTHAQVVVCDIQKRLSTFVSAHMSTHVPVHMPTHMPTDMSTHMPTHMPTHMSTHTPAHTLNHTCPTTCLRTLLHMCLHACLHACPASWQHSG